MSMQNEYIFRNNAPKVCVLLSSYNGGRYIKEQIDSIFAQKGVEVEIIVRDDGSTDNTIEIINSYGNKVTLIKGENVGCEQSFAQLLQYNSGADFYAFSDQDDYWLEDKLISEINSIVGFDVPALSACNLYLCDADLNIQKILHSKDSINKIRTKMLRDYLCNMHGCVLLWNKALHNVISNNIPDHIISHDCWVNSVANSIGKVVVLDIPLIKYRIHSRNVAGHASGPLKRLKKGFKRYFGRQHPKRDLVAKELLCRFKNLMNTESYGYDTLCKIASYKKSFRNKRLLIKQDIIKKEKYPDKLFWILCIFFNRY